MVQSEKRRQVRVPVDDEIYVKELASGRELGILANINMDGFMLIGDEGIKEDKFYELIIGLEPGMPDGEITLGAECLWISETGTGDQIWAGFQFTQVSDSARDRIEKLIQHYES